MPPPPRGRGQRPASGPPFSRPPPLPRHAFAVTSSGSGRLYVKSHTHTLCLCWEFAFKSAYLIFYGNDLEMLSRRGLTSNSIGEYSEMIVGAAYIAEGAEVAFPFGNQPGWDMVVRLPGGAWERVQVKTIPVLSGRKYPVLALALAGKRRGRGYTSTEADVIVAIHPESGTMWRVPSDVFTGKKRMRLDPEFLWRGSIKETSMPLCCDPDPLEVKRVGPWLAKQAGERSVLREQLPEIMPEWMPGLTWEMIHKWADGHGWKTIAADFGISAPAVRERVLRALNRLSIRDLPELYRFKDLRKRIPRIGTITPRVRRARTERVRRACSPFNQATLQF